LARAILHGETALGRTTEIERPDGTCSTLIHSAAPIRDEAGATVGGVAVTQDITPHRFTEEALRASEERFRATFEQMAVGMAHVGLDGQWLYVNQRLCEILGYDREELLQGTFQAITHPDDLKHDLLSLERLLTGEIQTCTRNRRCLKKGNEPVWVHLTSSVLRDVSGNPKYFIFTIEDITARKQAEDALRWANHRIKGQEQAIQGAPDFVCVIDRRYVYQMTNQSSVGVHGWAAGKVIGHTVEEIFGQDAFRQLQPYLDRCFSGTAVCHELVLTYPGVGPRPLEATHYPLRGDNGTVGHVVTVIHDIGKRKGMEQTQNESISIVSHELRTPLTSVAGALGLVAAGITGELPEKARLLIDIAHRNSLRLVRLINDILDIDKIESGKINFTLRPLELMEVIDEALSANSAYAMQFGVQLAVERALPSAKVYADADRLIQVLTNLLSNAIKFSPPDDTVMLLVERRAAVIRVSVTDHGPGIPEEFRDRIFEKFAQASLPGAKGGTGLGLNIARAIVEKLNGRIGYTTGMHQGTTFYFELPEWYEPAA
jgi:PAS domain S-box-containing protein